MTEAEKREYIESRLGDREWRMDNLYYVQNKEGVKTLFVRNESQMMFWVAMWYLNIILKDRQRGFSTLIAIFILDYCLFNSETSAGIIDITLEDAQLKLGKIKYAYENLPEWLKEKYPVTKSNEKRVDWKNKSTVRCGTSHRGGTLQLLHISEKGKIAVRFPERAREIRTGALNTLAPGQIVFEESTAEGNAGEFFEDCQNAISIKNSGAKLTKLDFKFHFFAWWMGNENEIDPDGIFISNDDEKYFSELIAKVKEEMGVDLVLSDRKKAWYVKKSIQQKDDMKREYPGTPSEAFEAAIEGAYLAKIINKLEKRGQITPIPIDPAYPVNTGWDWGISDHCTIWLHQRIEFVDRLVGYISGTDEDVLYYWKYLNDNYDCIWGYHFLPHDFASRRAGTANDPAAPPKTLETIVNDAGMRNTFIIPRLENDSAGVAEVRSWLPKAYIDKTNCDPKKIKNGENSGLTCLRNYRKEWDETNGCYKEKARHDWASHGYKGLESLVRGLNAYGCPGKIGTENDGIITKKRIG